MHTVETTKLKIFFRHFKNFVAKPKIMSNLFVYFTHFCFSYTSEITNSYKRNLYYRENMFLSKLYRLSKRRNIVY